MARPRLRQLVLAAAQLGPVEADLAGLGLGEPFRDPAVALFGLVNAVFAAGDCFVEVVCPARPATAVGRFLDRTGDAAGYIAMFEVADAAATRRRLAHAGVRVVWEHTEPDVVDLHLHPKDVPGAIVALDVTDPPGSWRWGGPAWTAAVPPHGPGGLRELSVAAERPDVASRRWADVLGVRHDPEGLALDDGRQRLRFVPTRGRAGIVAATIALPTPPARVTVAGVPLTIETAEAM